jgi:uncharacterized protein YbcI
MASDDGATASERANGPLAAEISRRMVQLVNEYTGRGPTRVRTYMHTNLIVCLLGDTLTKGERSLAAHGASDDVIRTRRTYQGLMREDAMAMIRELTGRTVIGFMSDHQLDPDLAIEAFVLDAPDQVSPPPSV